MEPIYTRIGNGLKIINNDILIAEIYTDPDTGKIFILYFDDTHNAVIVNHSSSEIKTSGKNFVESKLI